MSLFELDRFPHPENKEREFERTGVILVVAHQMPNDDGVEILLLRHKENLGKGIREGDWGLPSETTEPDDGHLGVTVKRLFSEELGVVDPDQLGLVEGERFSHRFNLTTGRNGPKSNAFGYGQILWTMHPKQIITAYNEGVNLGRTDSSEIDGITFMPLQTILSGGMALRIAPNPRRILSDLIRVDSPSNI
jgi:hypothetical protein